MQIIPPRICGSDWTHFNVEILHGFGEENPAKLGTDLILHLILQGFPLQVFFGKWR
jgi:hypothetical protein